MFFEMPKFERKEKTVQRPVDAAPEAHDDLDDFSADGFKALVRQHEEDVLRKTAQAQGEGPDDVLRQEIEKMRHPMNPEELHGLLTSAKHAARNEGAKEYALLTFPIAACTDRGIGINNQEAHAHWREALPERAKSVYQYWEERLRPKGFGIRAFVSEFKSGVGTPDRGAIFLTWK